ncbi:hypothetical protein M413DRAFT_31564 [Hebeloma cylindrosporum]|uniref:Uncharacterized protein n=1 Tax=Hebeloma cylindrosporum TaxID=76867 RepID=A0A0C3BYH5_HEBCY|nr:hypothetical protein M413DRAFT_31564 [Hebeloma cylindrosporum h7]
MYPLIPGVVRVCARLSAIGFPIGGRRFIDIDLLSQTGYLLILSTSYVKDEMPDIDEERKRKVKEAIGTSEEPKSYRQQRRPKTYLHEMVSEDTAHRSLIDDEPASS